MFSLLSGLLGFASAGFPDLLKFFQQRSDQKHEREMAQLQIQRELELAKAGFVAQARIEEIKTDQIDLETTAQERVALYEHDAKIVEKASQWVINLNALVRPVIAFAFVGELILLNFIQLFWAMRTGVDWVTATKETFTEHEMAITFTIVGFYFGAKTFEKLRNRAN